MVDLIINRDNFNEQMIISQIKHLIEIVDKEDLETRLRLKIGISKINKYE